MKTLYFIIILLSSFFYKAISQEVIATAGGSQTTDKLSINWTIGEAVIETIGENNLLLSQGFQQGNLEVLPLIEIDETIKVTVFPNPVNSILNIKIETELQEEFEILLFDMTGKLLLNKSINKTDKINLSHLQAASYRLQVKDKENKKFKYFNIIKIN